MVRRSSGWVLDAGLDLGQWGWRSRGPPALFKALDSRRICSFLGQGLLPAHDGVMCSSRVLVGHQDTATKQRHHNNSALRSGRTLHV